MTARPNRVLGLLPARGGSKRIPRKNIIDFFGKPMLAYPYTAAAESGLFDLIHVSSEDQEILSVAEGLGADVSLRRPDHLADDITPLLPLARWVVQSFDQAGQHFDDIVILFPCSPLLTPEDLTDAYATYRAHDRKKNLLTICKAPCYPEWYFRKQEDNSLDPITPGGSFISSHSLQSAYYETGTFTIFSREWLLGSTTLEDDTNYIGHEIPPWRAIDIDQPEDLEYARVLFTLTKQAGL